MSLNLVRQDSFAETIFKCQFVQEIEKQLVLEDSFMSVFLYILRNYAMQDSKLIINLLYPSPNFYQC